MDRLKEIKGAEQDPAAILGKVSTCWASKRRNGSRTFFTTRVAKRTQRSGGRFPPRTAGVPPARAR